MNLLIISHTPHYWRDGQLVGWGPTVREIDHLAKLFDQVHHLAVLYKVEAPLSSLPYTAENVSFVPICPSGGETLATKMGVLRAYSGYWRTMDKAICALSENDIVHVRCPANISLLAVLYLIFTRRASHRWIKYAGNWRPTGPEAWSYTFQRFLLNLGLHRGPVTVNGHWKKQPRHVYSFFNPSLTAADLDAVQQAALQKNLSRPVQILFIGRVEIAKGSERLLKISDGLLERGVDFELHIIGDGEERPRLERMAGEMGLADRVKFYGWLPHPSLSRFYTRAHFLVLPTSASEGWPKVISEGMAHGVVPLAGAVSSIPQILQECKTGMALKPLDTRAFVDVILAYLDNPERWDMESNAARQAAWQFTYEAYLGRLRAMFADWWGTKL